MVLSNKNDLSKGKYLRLMRITNYTKTEPELV